MAMANLNAKTSFGQITNQCAKLGYRLRLV
jgi:hypothetical protein